MARLSIARRALHVSNCPCHANPSALAYACAPNFARDIFIPTQVLLPPVTRNAHGYQRQGMLLHAIGSIRRLSSSVLQSLPGCGGVPHCTLRALHSASSVAAAAEATGTGMGDTAAEEQGQVVRIGKRVFVGNLAWKTSWQDLKDKFRECGNVVYTNVMRDEEGEQGD